jgi:phosphate transport system substrate-binding protein
MMRKASFIALLAAAVIGAGACSGHSSQGGGGTPAAAGAITLVGAGSTFDYPFFSRAFYEYHKIEPSVSINYQSIGSGGGIQQFTRKTVDFGATDVPMSAKELAAVDGGATAVLQIPVALGGVAIAYNLPDAPQHVRLSPAVLSRIFLGEVHKWSDPAIASVNSGARLPDLPIVVVHRADGSGTTFIFTDYLSRVSPEWKAKVGTAKTVAWPATGASVGMKGTEGVAGQIKNSPGAIGYVELAYALQTGMAYAALQNKEGTFVLPTMQSVRAAAATKPNVSAADFSIVNGAGANAYPLAGYSWALLYTQYPSAAKQTALCRLFHWLETDGQTLAAQVDYVELPSAVSARAVSALGPCP